MYMTPLLDIDTGTLTFSNGLRLEALMAPAALSGRYATLRDRELFLAVSYTHLTLPTIA